MDEANDDFLRLDRQVCFPLYAASNLISRRYRPALDAIGLTYPQYLVMLVLWEGKPQTVGALGDRLHLDSGTLTPLLKRMEHAGLIDRRRDPEDERRVLVSLTERGRTLREAARAVPASLAKYFALSKADIVTLRETVQQLVTMLSYADGKEQS